MNRRKFQKCLLLILVVFLIGGCGLVVLPFQKTRETLFARTTATSLLAASWEDARTVYVLKQFTPMQYEVTLNTPYNFHCFPLLPATAVNHPDPERPHKYNLYKIDLTNPHRPQVTRVAQYAENDPQVIEKLAKEPQPPHDPNAKAIAISNIQNTAYNQSQLRISPDQTLTVVIASNGKLYLIDPATNAGRLLLR